MCNSHKCKECNKLTWSGCGNHLESIFSRVKEQDRCFCGYTPEELEKEKKNPKIPSLGPLPKGDSSCLIF